MYLINNWTAKNKVVCASKTHFGTSKISAQKKTIVSGENIFVVSLVSSYRVCCHGNPSLVVQGCRSWFFSFISLTSPMKQPGFSQERKVFLTACVTHLIIYLMFVRQEKTLALMIISLGI